MDIGTVLGGWSKLTFLTVLALLAACGGGGGGSSSPAPPAPEPPGQDPEPAFGLEEREPFPALDLPLAGASLGRYQAVQAFAGPAFDGAILVTAVPGESRLAVVRQEGVIEVFEDAPDYSPRPILDLTPRVLSSGEQGLLGLAFDPEFVRNRYLYIYYSRDNPARSIVARFTWPGGSDSVNLDSEKILLQVEQPYANHNGGMLAFGPDDYLYIALGDGGSGGDPHNHAQDRSTLLGSLLRLDVHPADPGQPYAIPPDNPFVEESGVRPEIHAYGLRNPFRFSFDRQTGELWLGDVGQNAIEEIDLIEAGGNYGWRVYEGSRRYDDSLNTLPDSAFNPPVYEYEHSEGRSVIGGYVYRGSEQASLVGRYLYADYVSGNVWALTREADGALSNDLLANVTNPTSFGETSTGEVLLVSRSQGLYRLQDEGGATLPTQLSETGLFADLSTLRAVPGLIEYTVRQPFYPDGVDTRRWLAVPDGERIGFSASDAWTFPAGTVLVQHFAMTLDERVPEELTPLETRLLTRTARGWQGFAYRWNASGTDAELLPGRDSRTLSITGTDGQVREQSYEYPGRSDCLVCHTEAAGYVLGVNTAQLNRDFDYGGVIDNQLRSFNHIELLDRDIGDPEQYDRWVAEDDGPADTE